MALASLFAISGPKKSQFSRPSLPMALVMAVARIKIITLRAQPGAHGRKGTKSAWKRSRGEQWA